MFQFLPAIASALGAIGDYSSSKSSGSQARRQVAASNALQKEFAQNSIQWRVADAKAAGIHPLYALGAAGASYSPTIAMPDRPSFSAMGQDISRSIMAGMSETERRREVEAAAMRQSITDKQQIENNSLQNEMLRLQIARLSQDQVPPPAPMVMGGAAGSLDRVQPIPAMPTINSAYNIAREAGNVTDYAYARQDDGGLIPIPSMDTKNRIEDMGIESWLWSWRNRLNPGVMLQGLRPPSVEEFPLPPNHVWAWDPLRQAFYPRSTVRRIR